MNFELSSMMEVRSSMKVTGTAVIEVDISFEEALKVVLNHLDYANDRIVLEADDERNETGKRGLFRYESSYCVDKPMNFYLVTHNVERIKNFEVAESLYSRRNIDIFGALVE